MNDNAAIVFCLALVAGAILGTVLVGPWCLLVLVLLLGVL